MEAPESYPTFWRRVVDLLPQTSRCLGGAGEATGGMLAVGDLQLAGKPCTHCSSLAANETMILCDRCNEAWHRDCARLKPGTLIHDGPWFCFRCKAHIVSHGPADVTEDIPLIEYLFVGLEPPNEVDEERVRKLSQLYRAHRDEL